MEFMQGCILAVDMVDPPTDAERLEALLEAAESNGEQRTKALPATTQQQHGETHSGAMIALLPTKASAKRIVNSNGDPAEELHVTLAYLGDDASVFTEAQRDVIRAIVGYIAAGYKGGLSAKVPGAGTLGDASSVYFLGDSDRLDELHDDIWMALGTISGKLVADAPKERMPWIAHLTVSMDKPVKMKEPKAVGSLDFDRIRVAFGGDYTDFPLEMVRDGLPVPTEPRLQDIIDGAIKVDPAAYIAHTAVTNEAIALDAFIELYGVKALDTDPDPSPDPNATRLRHYWTRGPGAAKIRWGVSGDFMRCVNHLGKYVSEPKGLCNVYHKAATGDYPGQGPHAGKEAPEAVDGVFLALAHLAFDE